MPVICRNGKDGAFSHWSVEKILRKVLLIKISTARFLFDSVTALLANEMFPGVDPDLTAPQRVKEDLLALADHAENVVFVSDFIYSDAAHYDELTQAYRKGLADADRALVARCDCVAELCGGNIIAHKGVLPQW